MISGFFLIEGLKMIEVGAQKLKGGNKELPLSQITFESVLEPAWGGTFLYACFSKIISSSAALSFAYHVVENDYTHAHEPFQLLACTHSKNDL